MPLTPYNGTLDLKGAAHLLRRATFGATKNQIDAFADLTPAQAVASLFREALPDPVPPIDLKTGSEWMVSGPTNANSEDTDLEEYFLGWFVAQMFSPGVGSELSLAYSAREKIVMFLHTHFTTIKSKVGNSRALYFQNQLFRLFALDDLNGDPNINFKALTVKVSVDNAMLRLLDGSLNTKGGPNENYARELLELYSIGRGVEGVVPSTTEQGDYYVYTEEDVQKAALVLTGWSFDETFSNIDPDTNLPRGKVKGSTTNASSHDNDPKTFSTRFNSATIQPDALLMNGSNATEESALDEIRQLVDLIYSKQDATENTAAKNICWKIYRFYVYGPHTKEAIKSLDETIIKEMAATFINSGYKIQPVIEELLTSEHFFGIEIPEEVVNDSFGGIIKSPLDLIVGTLRMFEFQLPDMMTQTADFYNTTAKLLGASENQEGLRGLGMNFFEPYDVAGYEAYHQFPIYHRFWITPNSLATRYKFIRTIVNRMSDSPLKVDVNNFVVNNFNTEAATVNSLITALATYFYPLHNNLDFNVDPEDLNKSSLTPERLNYFKKTFLGNFDETYWALGKAETPDWLELLFNTMLQTPEYQLA